MVVLTYSTSNKATSSSSPSRSISSTRSAYATSAHSEQTYSKSRETVGFLFSIAVRNVCSSRHQSHRFIAPPLSFLVALSQIHNTLMLFCYQFYVQGRRKLRTDQTV